MFEFAQSEMRWRVFTNFHHKPHTSRGNQKGVTESVEIRKSGENQKEGSSWGGGLWGWGERCVSKGLEEVMRRRLERKKERKNVRIRWTWMKSRQRKEGRKKAVHRQLRVKVVWNIPGHFAITLKRISQRNTVESSPMVSHQCSRNSVELKIFQD